MNVATRRRPDALQAARSRSPQVLLRDGFLAAQHQADGLQRLALALGPKTYRRCTELVELVNGPFFLAARDALAHPTLATLSDAFDAIDAVTAALKSAGRSARSVEPPVDCQVWLQRASLLQRGLADVESGLEGVPLLPSDATDYPDEAN